MRRRDSRRWNAGCAALAVFASFLLLPLTDGNSIMDIINMERVEKLLAERRENASLELDQERRLLLQNSLDGDDAFLANDNDDGGSGEPPEEASDTHRDLTGFYGVRKPKTWHRFSDAGSRANHFHSSGTKGSRFRPNFTGIPEVSSLLADFTTVKVDKILKSDKNSQLVTKKEYLKKDWCKTEPIIQKIREDGCFTRTILNRFCYGQCNSFYIPKNPPRRKRNRKKQGATEEDLEENSVFKSCGFCKPKRSSWTLVTLRCPTLVPQYRKKKVQRIKQCKCLAENFN